MRRVFFVCFYKGIYISLETHQALDVSDHDREDLLLAVVQHLQLHLTRAVI